ILNPENLCWNHKPNCGGAIQLPTNAALDLRCFAALRLSLLRPADVSFRFKKASQRGLSSSTSSPLSTRIDEIKSNPSFRYPPCLCSGVDGGLSVLPALTRAMTSLYLSSGNTRTSVIMPIIEAVQPGASP